ncbi:sensor histidine kinase [Actinomadura sp. WMMA1423]|uniref:sensor histidine kinase n=1 Tax=Actinomadura sp. WMMA1423 TaxID=2591108 RepID=UPI002674CCC7|nr:histidine kinase [Actinomadura sp. WMMA1423]
MTATPRRPRRPSGPGGPERGADAAAPRAAPPGGIAGRIAGVPLRPRGRVADALLAAAVLAVAVVMSEAAVKPGDRPLWPGGLALITVAAAALAWRRSHPVAVLVVAVAVPPLYYPLGYPDGPVAVVLWLALFNAAVECRLAVPLGAVIVVNAGFLAAASVRGGGGDPDAVTDARSVASLSLGLLVTVAVGQYVRGRRALAEAAERRAAAAERDREDEARRRAVAERLRIARELHDVLAHQISLINVQAGAALHRRDDPARAYAALEAIKAASKETLRELRGVLGVLRQVDAADPGAGAADRPPAPPPSLARVGELLDQTAAAGLAVRRAGDLPEPGSPGTAALEDLPAPVGLAGYRIVQEALTNAVRHSGAAAVTVEVRLFPGEVVVRVDDDGAGPAGRAADGNGVRGMRERAASVGGQLTAGPGPAGGFRVWARLPLDAAAEPPGANGEGDMGGEGRMEEDA